jgi:hypothetical protein
MGAIEGIGHIEDGSTHGEERIGMGTIYTPGVRPPDSALNITIAAKMWSNGWHNMYVAGMPIFVLNDVDRLAAMRIPAPGGAYQSTDVRSSLIPAATVMTISQVNAFNQAVSGYILDIVDEDVSHKASGTWLEIGSGIKGSSSSAVKNVIENIPEMYWADNYFASDKDTEIARKLEAAFDANPSIKGFTAATGFDRLSELVKTAYTRADNLRFYNSIYLRNHLRPAGIVQSVTPSERTGTVNIGTTIGCTSQCLTYWPKARNFDYVGFCLTKIGTAFPASAIPTNAIKNAFALVPWHSAIRDLVVKDNVMRTDTEFRLWGDRLSEPTKVYCFGEVVRNDYMRPVNHTVPDYLVHGAGPDKNKEALTLAGISNFDGSAIFSQAFDLSRMRQMDMVLSVQLYP